MPDVAPLPERARLFHVGIPKSGTTSLQMAASAGRETLRANGVLYPGTKLNQRDAVLGFMERRWGWTSAGIPPRRYWDEVMAEIEADTERRVLFGHEFASESNAETAKRFIDAIGERTHVVVTLRSPGTILPSAWQQYVKAGVPIAFDDWLGSVIADPPDRNVTKGFHDRNDQAGVVQRWAEAAGADRVTVVVLDKRRPELLYGTFEQLLDLPSGTLAAQELGGFASNRGLSVPEAELFLALNEVIRPNDVQWPDFQRMVRNGAIRRIMESRDAGEEKLQLPPWAVKRAAEIGAGYADAIAATGVQVVGNLAQLAEEVPPRPHDDPPPNHIPVELAAEALAGMLSAATSRGAFFDPVVDDKSVEKSVDKSEERAVAMRRAKVKRMARKSTTKEVVWFATGFIGAKLQKLIRMISRR
ncbi:hypothetical protein [Aeromicrobium sp.]|uniref:hypothetical protein n=1 Tax=Aeromicrobium sp. TaxID=1871063 RepID=UPI003D6C6C33